MLCIAFQRKALTFFDRSSFFRDAHMCCGSGVYLMRFFTESAILSRFVLVVRLVGVHWFLRMPLYSSACVMDCSFAPAMSSSSGTDVSIRSWVSFLAPTAAS